MHSVSVVKVELMGFADRLDVECERKREVSDDSKAFGPYLGKWSC